MTTHKEILDMIKKINQDIGVPEPEPIDKTGMRPDQVLFWEGVERGDHLKPIDFTEYNDIGWVL